MCLLKSEVEVGATWRCLQLALQSLQEDCSSHNCRLRPVWRPETSSSSHSRSSLALHVENSTFHQTTAAFFSEWITEQSARFSRPSTSTLCPLLTRLNDAIVVGGCSADVELDEISFRSTGRAHGIVWVRYLAVARRGSSLGLVEAFGLPRYSEGSRWRRAHFCGRNVVRSTFAL